MHILFTVNECDVMGEVNSRYRVAIGLVVRTCKFRVRLAVLPSGELMECRLVVACRI